MIYVDDFYDNNKKPWKESVVRSDKLLKLISLLKRKSGSTKKLERPWPVAMCFFLFFFFFKNKQTNGHSFKCRLHALSMHLAISEKLLSRNAITKKTLLENNNVNLCMISLPSLRFIFKIER